MALHRIKGRVQFTVEQTTVAQRGLYSFFNLGTRWGWVISTTPWLLYPQE